MNKILLNDINTTNTQAITNTFSSTAEKIVLKVTGNAKSDFVNYMVYAINAEQNESVAAKLSANVTNGKFSIDYSFDPLYMSVYHAAVTMRVAIEGEGLALSEFSLEELSASEAKEHISASNIVIENGEKRAIVKQLDGTEITVPIIPQKVLILGNSLLAGMTYYGMCATDPENDYYHHVSTELKRQNPGCEISKAHVVHLEIPESIEQFNHNIFVEPNRITGKPTEQCFTPDLDLIILQGADNVNNPQRKETFKTTCEMLVRLIKERCPKARLIWVYGWYNKNATHAPIVAACEKWKVETIDLSAMMPLKENQATKGQTYIKPDGTVDVAPDGWLSHPGNVGMYRIAKKMLAKIGI